MLSFKTASLTNVPGQTASSTCRLVTNCPAFSTSNFKTANGFGRSGIARVPCHKHSLVRSSQNGPNEMWLLLGCINKTSLEHARYLLFTVRLRIFSAHDEGIATVKRFRHFISELCWHASD